MEYHSIISSVEYIARTLECMVDEYLQQFHVVVVTGPRRAGKSTMLQQRYQSFNYTTLYGLDTRLFAREDSRGFLQVHAAPRIIDEIQYVPTLLPYLKELIDQTPEVYGQWILTGSQHCAMMTELQEALAGRVGVLSLLPLSMHEALARPAPVPTFTHWWERCVAGRHDALTTHSWTDFVLPSLYPEPFLQRHIANPAHWLDSYVQTVIDRDLKEYLSKRNIENFARCVQLLATRTGQQVNAAAIGKTLGVDTKTIQSWMTLLQKARIIFLLPPYHRNFGKRISKTPKLYFFDTGIVCHLCALTTAEQITRGPMAGALFENFVVSELCKVRDHHRLNATLYYWRAHGGVEMDVVVACVQRLYPIEIKLTGTPSSHHLKTFPTLRALSPTVVDEGLLISTRPDAAALPDHVRNLHWSAVG
jgi:uncharacterized protein